MQQGDIIRISDVQSAVGYSRPFRNVYYYQVFTITSEIPLQLYSRDLAEAFFTTVLNPILGIQVSRVTHIELEFFNMTFQQEEATETWDTPIPGTGVADMMPLNVAFTFRLQRYARLLRNGSKRIAGVGDDAAIGGRELAPAYVEPVASVATALQSPLFVEGENVDATLVPLIVRVPDNAGVVPTIFTTVTEASFRGFGTQNSRKQL